MNIVRIFGDNLLAFNYADDSVGEPKNEFDRLFEEWQDPEYLETFFETHKSDLHNGFWGTVSVEEAIFRTFEYAQELEERLIELSGSSEKVQLKGLEGIFRPLNDLETTEIKLGKNKAKENWLRIYALRVDQDVYIVTGGAIKLTHKMEDREHTKVELHKMERCRNYLLDLGVFDLDGLIEELEG